jgi:hypothetical protein
MLRGTPDAISAGATRLRLQSHPVALNQLPDNTNAGSGPVALRALNW